MGLEGMELRVGQSKAKVGWEWPWTIAIVL